jgi:hypothetical protein
VSMSISNRSVACGNDRSSRRNTTLESLTISGSGSMARAQWLWLITLTTSIAVLENSKGTEVTLVFFSRNNCMWFQVEGGMLVGKNSGSS